MPADNKNGVFLPKVKKWKHCIKFDIYPAYNMVILGVFLRRLKISLTGLRLDSHHLWNVYHQFENLALSFVSQDCRVS